MLEIETAVLVAAKHLHQAIVSCSQLKQDRKADGTIVLNLDRESETIIKTKLSASLPIVSEEDPSSHHLIDSATDYILIDPIDGTSACKRYITYLNKDQNLQIGFGPLVGLVLDGRLQYACFFNMINLTLYSAQLGAGSFALSFQDFDLAKLSLASRRKLLPKFDLGLREAAVLFYPGKNGELALVEYLQKNNMVDTFFRFGGFANDCSRLVEGFEQATIQYSIKAWDFSAALLAHEAGLLVLLDPRNTQVKIQDWKIKDSNPLIITHPSCLVQLQGAAKDCLK